jgi:hypothetical protein
MSLRKFIISGSKERNKRFYTYYHDFTIINEKKYVSYTEHKSLKVKSPLVLFEVPVSNQFSVLFHEDKKVEKNASNFVESQLSKKAQDLTQVINKGVIKIKETIKELNSSVNSTKKKFDLDYKSLILEKETLDDNIVRRNASKVIAIEADYMQALCRRALFWSLLSELKPDDLRISEITGDDEISELNYLSAQYDDLSIEEHLAYGRNSHAVDLSCIKTTKTDDLDLSKKIEKEKEVFEAKRNHRMPWTKVNVPKDENEEYADDKSPEVVNAFHLRKEIY